MRERRAASTGRISYRLAESDVAHIGILWQVIERQEERIFQRLQLPFPVCFDAEIDGEQKDGRQSSVPRQNVLQRGVCGNNLSRETVLVNVSVLRRQRVTLHTERADPKLALKI